MEDVLTACEELLAETSTRGSYYDDALAQYDAARATGDSVSIALQMGGATEQLNQLKFRFIEVCTKQLFLEKIAATAAAEGEAMPCPTMQELAASELAAEQEKASLKRAKNERAAASERLEATCRDVASVAAGAEEARAAFARRIQGGRAGARLRNVTNVLESGSPEDVRKVAASVADHDAKACEQILAHMFSDLAGKEDAKRAAEGKVATLQAAMDRNARRQSELNTALSDHRAALERKERSDEHALALREESMRHEQIYEAMVALTRARTASVYDGGLCMELTVDRPVETAGRDGAGAKPAFTAVAYKLDMSLGSGGGEFVTKLDLLPADVDAGQIVSAERPLTILQVAQEVIRKVSRLPVAPPASTDAVESGTSVGDA
jgi:hypothetical protein